MVNLRLNELEKIVGELQDGLYDGRVEKMRQLNENITQLFHEVLGIKALIGNSGEDFLGRLQEARKQARLKDLHAFVTQLQSQMLDAQEQMRQTDANVSKVRDDFKRFEVKILHELRGFQPFSLDENTPNSH